MSVQPSVAEQQRARVRLVGLDDGPRRRVRELNQVVTVIQSNTSTNSTPLFGILNGQAWLYPADCSSHTSGTVTGPNNSGASFTIPTPGTYIIGIKYQTKTIAGAPAPVPADITYNFTTSLGGSTGASVLLKKH